MKPTWKTGSHVIAVLLLIVAAGAYSFPAAQSFNHGVWHGDAAFNLLHLQELLSGDSTCPAFPPIVYMGITEGILAAIIQKLAGIDVWFQMAGVAIWLIACGPVVWFLLAHAGVEKGIRLASALACIVINRDHALVGIVGCGGHVMIFPLAALCYGLLVSRRLFLSGLCVGFGCYSYNLFIVFVPALVLTACFRGDFRVRPIQRRSFAPFSSGVVIGASPILLAMGLCDANGLGIPAAGNVIRALKALVDTMIPAWLGFNGIGLLPRVAISIAVISCCIVGLVVSFNAGADGPARDRRSLIVFACSGILSLCLANGLRTPEFRYGVCTFYLAILACSCTFYESRRISVRVGAALCVVAIGTSNLLSYANVRPIQQYRIALGAEPAPNVPADEAIAQILLQDGVSHVVADYWMAYSVAVRSRGAVAATAYDYVRNERWDEIVRQATRKAFVFPPEQYTPERVEQMLRRYDGGGIERYAETRIAQRHVLIPAREP